MQKLNRTNLPIVLIIAALSGVVVFRYGFLWPVLLFVILGYTPSKDQKK
jgi:hypothetical protein